MLLLRANENECLRDGGLLFSLTLSDLVRYGAANLLRDLVQHRKKVLPIHCWKLENKIETLLAETL